MPRFAKHLKIHLDDDREIIERCGSEGEISHEASPCKLTLELTGTQWHCAAGRKLTSTPRGAMPLRVRVERPVRRHVTPPELFAFLMVTRIKPSKQPHPATRINSVDMFSGLSHDPGCPDVAAAANAKLSKPKAGANASIQVPLNT